MKLSKPNQATIQDKSGGELLKILLELYGAAIELDRRAPAAGASTNASGQSLSSVVNLAEVTVDFGAGDTNVSTVVSASWATAKSKIVACIADDARADEAAAEGVTVGVSGHAAGGFTVWAAAPNGAIGQFKVHAVGA